MNSGPTVAGLILAAGESRRMGFPKALLSYRNETFLDSIYARFAKRCCPVIVVLGAHADRIRTSTSVPADFVVNERYLSGQTSSMQCGLRAVPAGVDGVLFTLVDHPAVSPSTIDALIDGQESSGATLLRVPRYQGKRGHPIWLCSALIPEFLALPEQGAARDIVRSHSAQTEFLDVDDPGILADIDDPEAYRQLTGAVV